MGIAKYDNRFTKLIREKNFHGRAKRYKDAFTRHFNPSVLGTPRIGPERKIFFIYLT